MKHKFSNVLLVFTLVGVPAFSHATGMFDGLADGFDLGKIHQKTYATVIDKPLVDAFYTLSEDGKKESLTAAVAKDERFQFVKLTDGSLTMRRMMFKTNSMGEAIAALKSYPINPMEDSLGKLYVSFAGSRGNTVKQYKDSIGEDIGRRFIPHWELQPAQNTWQTFGYENALIESSTDGQIVSVMVRSHQVVNNFTVRDFIYVNIYFGKANVDRVVSSIPTSMFADNLMGVVTLVDGEAQLTAAAKTVAATPVASTQPLQQASGPTSTERRVQLLRELAELKKSGALTDAEFSTEKAKILAMP